MDESAAFVVVVRPQKAEALFHRLAGLEGVSACYAQEVRGTGHQKRALGDAPLDFLPKVVLGGWATPAAVQAVEEAVMELAPTGRSGDGKVFWLPLAQVIA